jgi:hypothetical protein
MRVSGKIYPENEIDIRFFYKYNYGSFVYVMFLCTMFVINKLIETGYLFNICRNSLVVAFFFKEVTLGMG